jgi:O-antigen/teichoic acid export membrane protein
MSEVINIGRKDIFWNYTAMFLKMGVGVILFPFILRAFSQETVAIWSIFSTIIALTSLLDFGFNPSFSRNVSYVMGGATELKKVGRPEVKNSGEIDYNLFKGLILAMRWFYIRTAFLLLALLTTVGTYYIHSVMKTYTDSHAEVYVAWIILVVINSYSLYTSYYDAIMQGKGLIKRSKQIEIVGQSVYLIMSAVLISLKFNLIAVISAQALSIIIRRILAHRTVYTVKFKQLLKNVKITRNKKEILKLIYPNALKLGLCGFGGQLIAQSPILIGASFLPLNDIASYGITMQIISIIAVIATVYIYTYQPKIAQYRVNNDIDNIKFIYLKSCILQIFCFIIGGFVLLSMGNWGLTLIKSQTYLLPIPVIVLALFISLLVTNHTIATYIIASKNEIPFLKANLFAGFATVVLLLIFLKYTDLGIWGLVISVGVAQHYQNWRWPITVIKDLGIKKQDIFHSLRIINYRIKIR